MSAIITLTQQKSYPCSDGQAGAIGEASIMLSPRQLYQLVASEVRDAPLIGITLAECEVLRIAGRIVERAIQSHHS